MGVFLNIVMVGVGGAIGAISRYLVDQVILNRFDSSLLGTFAGNTSGSLVLGIISGMLYNTVWPIEARLFVTVGILGSYTTFSTLSVATIHSVESGNIYTAVMNILSNLIVGLIAAYAGLVVGKSL